MADGGYVPRTRVDWTSNTAYSQFRLWRKEVERILDGPLADKDENVKLNHVYIWAGAHAETLIEAKTSEDPDLRIGDARTLLDQLASCLTHSTFFREVRHEFYNMTQTPNENTTTFYSRIMDLYRQADFPAGSDFLIVDKLIHGCINTECKRKLMAKGKTVTVKDCLDLMRRCESVEATMRHFGESSNSSSQVNAAYSRDPTKQSQRNGGKKKFGLKVKPAEDRQGQGSKPCIWCKGHQHPREKCPAKHATCQFCGKEGHFRRACLKKKAQDASKGYQRQNAIDVKSGPEPSDSESEDGYDLQSVYTVASNKKGNMVSESKISPREVLAQVKFHTESAGSCTSAKSCPYMAQGKVDTGAMVSCMPISMLSEIGLTTDHLVASKAILRGVTGVNLKNYGTIKLEVTCNDQRARTEFYVTKLRSELILGLQFCREFKLVTIAETCIQRKITVEEDQVKAVHITDESEAEYETLYNKWGKYLPLGKKTGDPLQDLKHIFPTTFDGQVGRFEGEVDLKLSPEAKPVQLPPRALPQSILPQLKEELDRMEKEGIIRACPETTEWVHNLVVVVKKNKSLRLCLDPRNLNKYLIRDIHYTASWEDAQHSFRNGSYFSTLDAKSGYWTKSLSKESQCLTAFNTPFKKYCFVRLPFGLSVSAEIFCEHMDRVLQDIPGTFPCSDDVKIQGSTEERHDLHLLETVSKAHQAGLKFNPDKCSIKKRKIEYFGRIVSPQGVEPCPRKVKAFVKLAPPTNKQELQSFLGTVNFMSTFIPNLTRKTHLMRSLLKRDIHYVWTSDMQKEFEGIKHAIVNAVQLTHYDPNKSAVIETDASQKGLGAVLIQDGQPVRFLSKALTLTETNYSNIERELLAI